jgi:hypothetical protein
MKALAIAGVALGVAAGIGCGGGRSDEQRSDTPTLIESSISDGCKKRVVREPFPDDASHARFRSLAEQALLIRCVGHPKVWSDENLSAYARFKNYEDLTRALASIHLAPSRYEELCLTRTEAFTTEFFGSIKPVCRAVEGSERTVRQPPIPYAKTHQTYIAQDGFSARYLVNRPKGWSSGGMAGSDNVGDVTWRTWNSEFAAGTGMSGLRGPCAIGGGPLPPSKCRGQNAYYEAPEKVMADEPRTCNDQGSVLRYFSRVRTEVYLRPGNPFRHRAGWWKHTYPIRAYKGKCRYFSVTGPVSG